MQNKNKCFHLQSFSLPELESTRSILISFLAESVDFLISLQKILWGLKLNVLFKKEMGKSYKCEEKDRPIGIVQQERTHTRS